MGRRRKKRYEYRPTAEAVETPRTIAWNGVHIAIGKTVTIKRTPPALPKVVREATPEEYETLFEEKGLTNLIEKVEISEEEE